MRASFATALLFALPLVAQAQTTKPSFATPAISPDGHEIAFASGGDIWTAPATGGDAHLLISNPAEESRPLYSPDGTRLAFQSTRTGADDIYVLTFATGQLQRITYTDAPVSLDAWSRDGQWLYFTSSADDVGGQGDIFRVHSSGGTPLPVSAERYLNEFESAPSPDGKSIVLVAKGISSSQWWRKGHAHIDETELWLKPLTPPSATDAGYKLLLSADAKHAWPMWSPDGHTLFFMSDKSGAENIWSADAATGAAKPVTHFTNGRCLWPTIAYDGKTILFERNFSIWSLNTATGKASELSITLRGVPSTPGITHERLSTWSNLALSPDGKKVAVVAHGEVFAASAKDGGEPQRLTHTPSAESDPQWSPDSTKLLYLSERDGGSSIYEYDFTSNTERALTHSANIDLSPTWSPDGNSIAYLRDRKELHILTLADTKGKADLTDKVIANGEINSYGGSSIAWSPDSHWVVFVPTGVDGFTNLFAVPADGSAPARPLTFLANGQNGSHLAWSPDGKYILFDTAQRAETPHLARVDLVPHVPAYREDQFTDLFRKQTTPGAPDTPSHTETKPDTEAPATEVSSRPESSQSHREDEAERPASKTPPKKPEPTRIVFDGIRDRLTLLPIDLDLRFPIISPDGKTLAFLAEVSGAENIYTYSLDELSHEPATPRQLTSTAGSKSNIAFTPDSKALYYLEGGGPNSGAGPGGTVRSIAIETRTPKPLMLSTSIDVDFDKEKMVVFNEAWTTLDHRFWNGEFNGADWPALRDEWRPYIEGARTGPELRRDILLLIGELNSSHSGISKREPPAERTGRLGLRFEREPYERDGSLIVREIVPLGPAALATADGKPAPLAVGDHLLAVDDTPITHAINLDSFLLDKSGKRVVLTIAPAGDMAKKHDIVVRPVPLQVESGLLYRAWVESRRAYVDKVSGGKLGYVHLAAMGDDDLAQLYLDLDVQNESKEGVIVDVRNNNGGYVNGRVIDVFARKNYLLMTPRNGATVPSRQALGQRALGLPTALVTNESTLSDGEDFTEGYRALQLGKVIGTPTAGWIIFTGASRLIDGSQVRVPGERIRTLDGKDMEMHPRPVDIEQLRPLGETETGEDIQLKTAVTTLINQLKK
ncbi:peptidase S41 [Granulicella sp. 5B5]|uniref:S41 family peptidase n=1 Tax=Granulicella sp. 5B5 TaxID=1617967 RepID=UPI0015F60453|nr:S41 family peptidase [Granulicella sp. 5B5]QMV18282.1 peptidase S41 [Granulicella sp. 5B5]